MKNSKILGLAVVTVFLLTGLVLADNSGRIYGKIYTRDGNVLEGLIRWDKNEGDWVDILNGTKDISKNIDRDDRDGRRRYSDRSRSIKIFGLKIIQSDDNVYYTTKASSGVRFGDIKSLEVLDDDRALITLKSGEEVEYEESSTDIGSGIREIVIEDRREGELELVWDDIDRIEFMAADTDEESNFGNRLYGTVSTRKGYEFTGFICWDVDELFETDILDGDEDNRRRKIKFGKIKAIERYSSSKALVIMKNGDEMILSGTNDVNDDNRGIVISDFKLGDAKVDWSEFDRIDFKEAPGQIGYDRFDGGKPLEGTVYTDDGDEYKGRILWDNDEGYTWEMLDGDYRSIEFSIVFGNIKKIERDSRHGATVTLRDGREFYLRDSNDIDDDNKGIFVFMDDGEEIVVDWNDFERVEF